MKIIATILSLLLLTTSSFADPGQIILSASEAEDMTEQSAVFDYDNSILLNEVFLSEVPDDDIVCRKVGTSFVTKCCDSRGVCWIE